MELEDYIKKVDYTKLNTQYEPKIPALHFINFIKLVNGLGGEENKSPVIHMDMIDSINDFDENLYISFRGSAKTSVVHEYMFLYLAVYGEFFDFGEVSVAMYISDTIDNGVKSMRKNLEARYYKSDFLQQYIPKVKFTDVRWEFTNLDGHSFVVRGFGANTGVRGFKEYAKRPTWCAFDDLMSDKNAESPTIIRDIKNIVYKAARQAMHPLKRKMLWTGTPFNKKDPLYAAASTSSWNVKVYPICERFPCTKEDFVGAWEDRFGYDFVRNEYEVLKDNGELQAFNQELMLRIISEEDRLIFDCDIRWYMRKDLLMNKGKFNFYITTDFATSEEESADFSAISVWAVNSKGDWFWVDGVCKKQDMGANVDDLFRLAQMYLPLSVGVEVSGQQGGFIPWLKKEMMLRNIWFSLATENNKGKEGIRPVSKKLVRFQVIVPWFKAGRMYFPTDCKDYPAVVEIMEELSVVSSNGFKSKHDDMADTISMLTCLNVWYPSEEAPIEKSNELDMWEFDEEKDTTNNNINSYLV